MTVAQTQLEAQEPPEEIAIRAYSRRISLPDSFADRVGELVTTKLKTVGGKRVMATRKTVGGKLVKATRKTVGGNLVMAEQSMLCQFPSLETPNWEYIAAEEYYDPNCGLTEPLMYLAELADVALQLPYTWCSRLSRPAVANMCYPSIGWMMFQDTWGTVEMGPGVKQAEIIGDVCRGFPRARVLVLGPHVGPLGRLCNSIRRCSPDISSVDVSSGERNAECPDSDADEDDSNRPQLVFTTYLNSGLVHLTEGTEYNKFDIALCLQPELLSGHTYTQFLGGADINFRHYGLVSAVKPLSTPERHQMINVFGIRRVRIPESGYERSEVSWVSIRGRSGIRNILPTTRPHETLQLQQLNGGRNSCIARAAKRLAGTDRQPIEGIVGSWISGNVGVNEPLSVLVVASDTNQAGELAALMPGWPILDLAPHNNSDIQQNLTLTPRGLIQFGICTRAALDHLPAECNPNIIVNAAGGPHALVLPKRWLQHQVGSQCCSRRLIIDFEDHGTALTKRWSQLRSQDYVRNDIFEYDEAITNADQFSLVACARFISETFRPAR